MKFSTPLTVKFAPAQASDEAEIGFFTGYANTWQRDRHKDYFQQGAFANSVKAMEAGELSVPLLWNHDHQQPIGAILSGEEDDRGLKVAGQLVSGTAVADRAYALLKKGALSLSVGFTPLEYDPIEGGGFVIKAVDLMEVSLVPMPANAGSTIQTVRSLAQMPRSEWERMWANGTLPPVSNSLSAVLTKACMQVLNSAQTDEPEFDAKEIAAVLTEAKRVAQIFNSRK
jgi:HK97 family phage prohead protease